MSRYICKCGRAINKSTNADNTGNRDTDGCAGCPYLMPWGTTEWDHTRHAMVTDVKGYECRMSPSLEYETRFGGSVTDKRTCYIASLDFDFLERVSDWIKATYPGGELNGGFNRDRIRAVEYVSNGRYRLSISCAQNKAGIAAKAALLHQFFDASGRRLDMDADAEKQKILHDIAQGKAAAHKNETNTMLTYRDPATGWLYRVSPEPKQASYWVEYLDPANSVIWKPSTNLTAGNETREGEAEYLALNAKSKGWEPMDEAKSQQPAPCDGCPCPSCDDSSCLQARCDKADKGFGCIAPDEDCPHAQAASTTAAPAAALSAGTDNAATACLAAKDMDVPATPFDYSGLDAQTVATLHSAENIIRSARKEYVIKVADAVGMAHDELVANCDKRGNQYSENTFRAWCASVGIGKDAAYRLLQVSNLLESSTPNEQKILNQASPSLLYAAAKPSAPAELVQAVKDGDITTHKQYKELETQLKAEREAREKAAAEAQRMREDSEQARAAAHEYHVRAEAAEAGRAALLDQQGEYIARIHALESRPIDVAVAEPSPVEVERLAREKAREMTAMLQAQVRGLQEDLDDARLAAESAGSSMYDAADQYAQKTADAIQGMWSAFLDVSAQLSEEEFQSVAAPLFVVAKTILDTREDGEE